MKLFNHAYLFISLFYRALCFVILNREFERYKRKVVDVYFKELFRNLSGTHGDKYDNFIMNSISSSGDSNKSPVGCQPSAPAAL